MRRGIQDPNRQVEMIRYWVVSAEPKWDQWIGLMGDKEMKTREHLARWLTPIAIITSPFWVGAPLLCLGELINSKLLKTLGYVIAAVIPQFTIFLYCSYYHETHFPHGWIATILHWTCVLVIYALLTWKRPIGLSLAIFTGLFIGSIIVAHKILKLIGYKFFLVTL